MKTSHLLAMSALLVGCTEEVVKPVAAIGDTLPDFTLEDQNSTSATFGQQVSTEAFRGQVTAWYFGHAT